jgi:hypothetical protein
VIFIEGSNTFERSMCLFQGWLRGSVRDDRGEGCQGVGDDLGVEQC